MSEEVYGKCVLTCMFVCLLLVSESQSQFACNFETDFCGMQQDQTDSKTNTVSFDWTRISEPTPTLNTGPYLGAEDGSNYIYIEASAPQLPNDEARILIPRQNTPGSMCLSFWYNMYGSDIGMLHVFLQIGSTYSVASAISSTIVTFNGEQGNQWLQWRGNITFTDPAQQIVFRGVRGNGPNGDISIDNIVLTSGLCPKINPTILPFMCSFETVDMCGCTQPITDTFNWISTRNPSPNANTGPHSAIDGLFYMYIDSRPPRKQGDTAALQTPPLYYTGLACLSFDFHMYGTGMGCLKVFTSSNPNTPLEVWTGSQGNDWMLGRFTVNLVYTDMILFVGTIGTTVNGDIAIDNIQISAGFCQETYDMCTALPCAPGIGATCVATNSGVGNRTCECGDEMAYFEDYCSPSLLTPPVHCDSVFCEHGGTCVDSDIGFTCLCVPGATGAVCETDVNGTLDDSNECNSGPCMNGGQCVDLINSYTCTCTTGFGGVNCEQNQKAGSMAKTTTNKVPYIILGIVVGGSVLAVITVLVWMKRRMAKRANGKETDERQQMKGKEKRNDEQIIENRNDEHLIENKNEHFIENGNAEQAQQQQRIEEKKQMNDP